MLRTVPLLPATGRASAARLWHEGSHFSRASSARVVPRYVPSVWADQGLAEFVPTPQWYWSPRDVGPNSSPRRLVSGLAPRTLKSLTRVSAGVPPIELLCVSSVWSVRRLSKRLVRQRPWDHAMSSTRVTEWCPSSLTWRVFWTSPQQLTFRALRSADVPRRDLHQGLRDSRGRV